MHPFALRVGLTIEVRVLQPDQWQTIAHSSAAAVYSMLVLCIVSWEPEKASAHAVGVALQQFAKKVLVFNLDSPVTSHAHCLCAQCSMSALAHV